MGQGKAAARGLAPEKATGRQSLPAPRPPVPETGRGGRVLNRLSRETTRRYTAEKNGSPRGQRPGAEPGSARPSLPLALRLAFARTWAFSRLTLKHLPHRGRLRGRGTPILLAGSPGNLLAGGRRHHLAKAVDSPVTGPGQRVPEDAEHQDHPCQQGRINPEAKRPGQWYGGPAFDFLKRPVERHDLEDFQIVEHAEHRVQTADDQQGVHGIRKGPA